MSLLARERSLPFPPSYLFPGYFSSSPSPTAHSLLTLALGQLTHLKVLELMGCKTSKPEDQAGQYGSGVSNGHGSDSRVSFLRSDAGGDQEAFREKLFASVGEARTFSPGEIMIEEGKVRFAFAREIHSTRPRTMPALCRAALRCRNLHQERHSCDQEESFQQDPCTAVEGGSNWRDGAVARR